MCIKILPKQYQVTNIESKLKIMILYTMCIQTFPKQYQVKGITRKISNKFIIILKQEKALEFGKVIAYVLGYNAIMRTETIVC